MTDVYERLATHLDTTPAGYPRTSTGVELRILRRLFTAAEAELALHLTVIPEEARVVARRARRAVADVARQLEEMGRKGLVHADTRDGLTRFMLLQFVVGFWEMQVNRLTPDLIRDFEEYLPTLFDPESWARTPQMRVVPVNTSIEARGEVLPHELVEELVRQGQGRYAVANCICRQERTMVGQACDRPMESCLTLGGAADDTTRSGRGRPITREETLDILRRADEAGLVLHAANARESVFLCTCCGCCCGVLRSIKRHPAPARIVSTPFVAALATESCQGCGACESRCQMDALRMADGVAALADTRCIGCGLCVSTCPSGALRLVRKPEGTQPSVPGTFVGSYLKIGRTRGRFGVSELASLKLRSIVDRWLA